MYQTSDKSKFRSGMHERKQASERSGFHEAPQKFLHKDVQRTDASAMEAWGVHTAIATRPSGLDHSLGWKSGISLFMKASKSGTVKAISL
jgi:hypothetical protein